MNLNQVTVPALDIAASISFYQTLGLKLIVHSKEHYARFECPNGAGTFSLHKTDHPVGEHGIWVYFECQNLDEHVAELIKKGINFDSMPTDQPWKWREAHLKDPSGNQLILFYAGDNRKNPPWRLS